MLDLKTFKSALEQLEEERKIPKEKILDTIEQAMAAAYKKDYGKKGQIIRAKFDPETGKTDFFQIKIVVDESIVKTDTDEKNDEPARNAFGIADAGGGWETMEGDLWGIDEELDKIKHHNILPKSDLGKSSKLRKADKIEIQAGKIVEWK